MTGRLLELKCPHLYWTPCAAHCLDLMLEDIGKLPNIKRTLERAISLNGYIYNRSGLLNMMRQFTRQRELLRISGPLVRVFRLVDSEKKAPMGYIYEAMNRAKDTNVRSLMEMKKSTKKSSTSLIRGGRFSFIDLCMLTRDLVKQEKVVVEVSLYTNAQGLFENELAVRIRKTRAPASTPNLQRFAMKVLNLTCSASGCEWNWSIFENIHNKRKNRLDHQHLNDLVYIKYNRALKRRYDEDDFVFDDDNLTWGDVAKATGVEEARRLKEENEELRAQMSLVGPSQSRQTRSHRIASRRTNEASFPRNETFPFGSHTTGSEEELSPTR
ncbi:hypothetical protein CK203_088214 [Vitis vinifera]|uniref:DUF659 domain-containing protein n=1 Tax=Vitis vinifera TaxID=29760 RepID=A0A438FJK4_VITVI|nr:hypothetical protein CK203_088214 [Vitis vinifera]